MRPTIFGDVTQRELVVTDVSAQRIGTVFKGYAVEEEFFLECLR